MDPNVLEIWHLVFFLVGISKQVLKGNAAASISSTHNYVHSLKPSVLMLSPARRIPFCRLHALC